MNIKAIAQKAVTMSELMEGRDKIETKDIIKYYPEGIHIIDADKISMSGEDKDFYVYIFDEDKKVFAFAGMLLNKIFDGILEACEGDFDEFHKILRKETLLVRLSEGKTKEKQPITLVEVI